MKNTDLHTHSNYSDGEFSPEEVVKMAKKAGVKNLALTDHNSVNGIDKAIRKGEELGVRIIPAVEVKALNGEILGYFIDYKNPKLKKDLERTGFYDDYKTRQRIEELKKLGVDVCFSEFEKKFLNSKDNYNTGHLIYYLREKGYDLEEIYEFFDKIEIKKPKKQEVSLIFAIKLVRKYKGIPVLAHPWIYCEIFNKKNIKTWIKAGLKGIEFENGDKNKMGRTREFSRKIKKFAKKYNLILTQGSDFHGNALINASGSHKIGKTNCDEKVVNRLEKLRII